MKLVMNKGDKYGRLTVIKEVKPVGTNRKVKCKCECGVIKDYYITSLRNSRMPTRSCGCLRREIISTHKQTKSYLYRKYRRIWERCYNKKKDNYEYYGGRGITLCDEWLGPEGFSNFKAWNDSLPPEKQYKKGLEIDRRNNDKGYSPKNCRWVTKKKNMNNRRNTVTVEYKGKKYGFAEFHRKYGNPDIMYRMALQHYVRDKWNFLDAATKTKRSA